MSEQTNTPSAAEHGATDRKALEDMIAESDTGARQPKGIPHHVLWIVPLAWSLFQLWYSSPLPTMLRVFILDGNEARSIHLAFALFLTFLAYPASKRSPRDYIPIQDWVFAFVGAASAAYLYVFYAELADRPGAPITQDIVIAVVGLAALLEATRRALGPPLMVVAIVFLVYTFAGPYMPDVIAHKGASLNKGMSHYWLTTEGVFGIALGVSTSMVFLFVLFGSLLEKAGAGNYFIQVAFALLGHMRGGPAKAAVVSSALTGMVSGSSIANVVTTGTFTIPLMRRVGFTAEKAGAVEVASSTNGQLTPPIMGAAAFLMFEYVGISYVEVIKHAFLPAIISYIALVYIVHLEAMKAGMMGLPRRTQRTIVQSLLSFVMTILGLIVPLIAVHMFVFYFGILADDTPPVGLAAFAAAAISRGDPIRTGLQGFAYDIRTAILPFLFIFNTELLMIGIEGPIHFLLTVGSAVIAMLVFAAATQGFFLVRCRLWEIAALLLVAFTLFRPGFWMDMIYPPTTMMPGTAVLKAAEAIPAGGQIQIRVKGKDLKDEPVDKVVMLRLGEGKTGTERLKAAGLELREDKGKMIVDNVGFGSPAEKQKIELDWELASVVAAADVPDKQWMYLPAILLLGGIVFLQRRRRDDEAAAQAA
jgi:TRAP-type uncharacterized transport system fused permease subunit